MIYPSDLDIILAKRRNPEINNMYRKNTFMDDLRKYKDNENLDKLYLTATQLEKVGIRPPSSIYVNSLGFCLYGVWAVPLKSFLKKEKPPKEMETKGVNYINIIEEKDLENFRHLYTKKYNITTYKEDLQKVLDYYNNLYDEEVYYEDDKNKKNHAANDIGSSYDKYSKYEYMTDEHSRHSYVKSLIYKILTLNICPENYIKRHLFLTKTLINVLNISVISFQNYNKSGAYETEAIFMHPRSYKLVERFINKYEHNKYIFKPLGWEV